MLYRQLIFFNPNSSSPLRIIPKITDSDLSELKSEIRDIASCHLGYCFTRAAPEKTTSESSEKSDREWEKWRKAALDVVLQIAMRATQAQSRAQAASSSTNPPPMPQAPDARMLSLAERWLDTNMRLGSTLSVVLRNKLRDAVFHGLTATTFPSRDAALGNLQATLTAGTNINAPTLPSPFTTLGPISGMESITDEIRTLAEKLSRLSLIHLGVYLSLYEQEGFLDS